MSPDFVGIKFPDGSVMGDEGNVKLRFDDSYMQMAADGEL
jgi:NitT/TauT family transport system substrate-binding protein